MRLWALILVLLCAAPAVAQAPACFRSKYASEWPVEVKRIELRDGNKLSKREKSTIVRELRRECDCWPCALSDAVSEQIREMYQWYGYFQAVADVEIRKSGYNAYSIRANVQEGPQYRLAELVFVNARAFPASELRQLFPIQNGAPFDTRKIRQGLDAMRRLYAKNGYIDFTPVPDTRIDRDAGTIVLNIDVNEGTRYRFGPLVLSGAEPAPGVSQKLQEYWKAYIGRPYDPGLLERFVDEHALLLKIRSANFLYTNVEPVQDAKAAIVTVRLRYSGEVLR
ncbi:MAG: POTRA domain-containing protein [Terriglobales bacterium]